MRDRRHNNLFKKDSQIDDLGFILNSTSHNLEKNADRLRQKIAHVSPRRPKSELKRFVEDFLQARTMDIDTQVEVIEELEEQ